MILLFKLIAITSILVLGYTAASQKDMVLYPLRQWAERQKGTWAQVVFLCHWCMPSLWTGFAYFFIWVIGCGSRSFTWNEVAIYPLVVCGSSMLNGLVWVTYKSLSEIDQYYRDINEWTEYQKLKAENEAKEKRKQIKNIKPKNKK